MSESPANTTNDSQDRAVRDRVRRLVSTASDRQLSDAEVDELSGLLERHRELVPEYVDCVSTESIIGMHCGVSFLDPSSDAAVAESMAREAAAVHQPHQSGPLRRLSERLADVRSWAPLLAVAAGLLLVVGAARWWNSGLGSVVAVRGAEWAEGACDVGSTLAEGWCELESGSVDVVMKRGAMVSFSGPTRFRLTGRNRCEVDYGAITARIGSEARGFTVDAPLCSAVDLGTGFRMDVSEDGRSTVHVTEGLVNLIDKQALESLELGVGEIGAASESGLERRSPMKLGLKGAVSFEEEHPKSLGYRSHSTDESILVFLETAHLRLPHDVVLNVSASGSHTSLGEEQGIAEAGALVDCYLIHSSPSKKRHLVEGQITFPGQIVGVICDDDRLNATNAVLGSPWSLRCEHPERGLESLPDRNSDVVTISRDRRSLSIGVRTESIDQLRVLISVE